MTPKSVYEAHKLSSIPHDADAAWDAPTLPPLALVAHGTSAPLLVITYDRKVVVNDPSKKKQKPQERVDLGIPRIDAYFTHMNVTILPGPGERPKCASFGAASLLEQPIGGKFRKVNDTEKSRKEEERIFSPMKDEHPIVTALFNPRLEYPVNGMVIDESWRHGDNFMSVVLKDWQVSNALEVIQDWQQRPRCYALRATYGNNCRNLVSDVIDGTGIAKPSWWKWPSLICRGAEVPGYDAMLIEALCGGKPFTSRDNVWLMQSRNGTRMMLDAYRRKTLQPA